MSQGFEEQVASRHGSRSSKGAPGGGGNGGFPRGPGGGNVFGFLSELRGETCAH